MNRLALDTIRCGIRTVGALCGAVLLFWGAKYLELTYEDAKIVLAIVNAYGPELMAITLFVANGIVFYRATQSKKNFDFIHFFIEGKAENVYRLGYFLLLQLALWSIFALFWRDKLDAAYMMAVGGIFVGKAAVDSIGHHFGKPPREKAAGDSQ